MRNSVKYVGLSLLTVAALAILPSVAAVYGEALSVGPTVPKPLMQPIIGFQQFDPKAEQARAAEEAFERSRTPKAALDYSLIPTLVIRAQTKPQLGLWTLYPASVRGTIFGGSGNDPVLSMIDPRHNGSAGW